MSESLCWLSAVEVAELIRTRQISPVELVEACLAQVDHYNDSVTAIITRCDQAARQQAAAAEKAVLEGAKLGPLHGVPFTAKDLHLTNGVRTTLGSRLYSDFVPDWDQPIVDRLKRAGAILLGKTNTSEFGLIPLAANSLFGESHNPWNLEKNTGGSSGGAAAAVACGMGPLATGSDGGGSIRVPASFCGVFGIKPQMGRIPNVAFPRGWESLAHQGPLTRSVRDAALFLDATAGLHPQDRRSLPNPTESFFSACEDDPQGLRLAWCPSLGQLPVDRQVHEVCQSAARRFESLGCQVEEVQLDLPDLTPAQQTIAICEAVTGMADRLSEWQEKIYPPTSRMIPKSERYRYQDLIQAQWSRDEYWETLGPLFATCDALLTPTVPIAATDIGTLGPQEIDGTPIRALAWLSHCVPFNMTWQPAATVPAGTSDEGLPIGLQIVARPYDERTLFRLAAAYETAFSGLFARPPLLRKPVE